MADVARLAGVSTMTVSRALKPDSYIRNDTREKILKAVDELGYVIDTTAAGLSSRRTGFVAMIIPSINNSNFAQTVRGASDTLKEAGLQLLLAYTNYDIHEEEKLVAQLLARRPEGIILTGGRHTPKCRQLLERVNIPVIETWDEPQAPVGMSVGFSNRLATKLTLNHLRSQGCEKIVFVGGDHEADSRGFDRRMGYVEAAKTQGFEPMVVDLGKPPVTMEHGLRAFEAFRSLYPQADGAICVSDLLAFGFVSAASRLGLQIPRDLKLAGFGDYDIAKICVPSLTTVAVEPRRIGELAARCAISIAKGQPDRVSHHQVEVAVVARETTAIAAPKTNR